MIPSGTYTGYLKEAVTSKAKTGTPSMALTFYIDTDDQGRVERTVYLYLSDGAWPYSEEKLEYLGFDGDFANPTFNESVTTDGVTLLCKHESYEGEVRERWDILRRRPIERAPDGEVSQLNKRWRSRSGGAPKPAAPGKPVGAPPPKPAKPAPPPPKQPEIVDTAKFIDKVTDYDSSWEQYVAVCEASGSEPDSDVFQRLAGEYDTTTVAGCKQLFTAACAPF